MVNSSSVAGKLCPLLFFGTAFVVASAVVGYGHALSSQVYTRPVPELPLFQDPAVVNDLYTYSMIFQVHAALFRMDEAQHPSPYLAEGFSVSTDQKVYSFRLRKVSFHNGKPVSARAVKLSLENAIRKHAVNFEAFSSIEGFGEFTSKRRSTITGIVGGSKDETFEIRLIRPDPGLLNKLTDVRFAIWDVASNNPKIGAGPYSVASTAKSHIVLKRFQQKALPDFQHGPDDLVYRKRNTSEAIADFHAKKVDDLFFYSLPEHVITNLKGEANVQSIYFPRTYFAVLHSDRLTQLKGRESILAQIDPQMLVKKCFPSNHATMNLVPPGFVGHQLEKEKAVERTRSQCQKRERLVFYVVESIGEEDCIVQFLNDALKNCAKSLVIQRQPLSTVIRAWQNSKVDGFLSYLEGESTVHYFGSFNPKADFRFGVREDKNFVSMFDRFDQAKDSYIKQTRAEELADYILKWNTFLPLFHPKSYLVYQKKFDRLKTPFQSAALIPVTDFKVNKNTVGK